MRAHIRARVRECVRVRRAGVGGRGPDHGPAQAGGARRAGRPTIQSHDLAWPPSIALRSSAPRLSVCVHAPSRRSDLWRNGTHCAPRRDGACRRILCAPLLRARRRGAGGACQVPLVSTMAPSHGGGAPSESGAISWRCPSRRAPLSCRARERAPSRAALAVLPLWRGRGRGPVNGGPRPIYLWCVIAGLCGCTRTIDTDSCLSIRCVVHTVRCRACATPGRVLRRWLFVSPSTPTATPPRSAPPPPPLHREFCAAAAAASGVPFSPWSLLHPWKEG